MPDENTWFSEVGIDWAANDPPVEIKCAGCEKILIQPNQLFAKVTRLPDKTLETKGYYCEGCAK